MRQQLLGKTLIVFWLFAACLNQLSAQTPVDSTIYFQEKISDTIPKIVDEIIVIGNKITKPSIILRELTFRKGDTLNPSEINQHLKRSENNVKNTSLFNTVQVSWVVNNPSSMSVFIILKERWYIFPIPIFELVDRNFNAWWREKDFTKINYGAVVTWNNFRGRNETVGMTLRLGYTHRVSFFYTIPFISKEQRSGLSFAFAYSRNHETPYKTYQNDLLYYKDVNNFTRKEVSGSIQYGYRRNLYRSHLIEAGYRYAEVQDSVILLNPDFFAESRTTQKYFTLRYFFKIEHRDIVAYPLKGFYFDAGISKTGFPMFNDEIDILSINSAYKRYWDLGSKFYFSSSVNGKISTPSYQPYYNTRALGYGGDYLRGYEYYVVDGQKFGLLKTNLKFALVPQSTVHASFIPIEKFSIIHYAFYLNAFADAGYAQDKSYYQDNSLTNSWLYSYGAGIDFVTFYDLVFRVEYSVNKFGESGIFLHFSAPI